MTDTREIKVGDRVRCGHKHTGTVMEIDDSRTRFPFVAAKVARDDLGEGRWERYRLSDLTLVESAAPATERKGPATRTGCSMCGDDVPAMLTPRGWLCRDCATGH